MEEPEFIVDQEFDWSLDPKLLRDNYQQTNFDSGFFKLINRNVIKYLAPQKIDELHNLAYDEDLIYEHLISPIEKFICGLDKESSLEDVQKSLKSIQTLNQPSKLCRRILKTGDVTFACNDCGLDDTCVVCIDCFHKGSHKDHNYRMSNSDGGGCCDCGDTEAWKQNYACSDHMALDQPNTTLSDFEDIQLRAKYIQNDKKRIIETITRLPPGVAKRYFMACQASLHYARTLISWQDYRALPEFLTIEDDDPELAELLKNDESASNYFTVLYNDEIHTYDFVIATLVKIIKCNRLTASFMASTVSREGRCLLINDDYATCKQVRDYIANARDSGQNNDPLKVEVMHGTVLAHQAFAFKLLEWIRQMTTICDSFRILTAYTFLGTYNSTLNTEEVVSNMTLIEKIMLSNTEYWKIARVEWNDLFVKSMLTDYSIKEQFARLLTRNYPKLMQDFMQDDHDPSVSILSMTTQLYTVPSLACMLVEEENVLTVLYRTFADACNNARRENLHVNFENRKTFDMLLLKRGFHTLMDVKFILGLQPTKWTSQLRKNVIDAVEIIIELLSSLQGMDSVRRQQGQHVEYEPDWESGMSIQSRLSSNITRLIEYCSYDEEVLLTVLKKAQAKLLRNTCGYKMSTRELFGHKASCISYDVATSPVSVHLPLTRFVVALINELMRRRQCDKTPFDESLVILAIDDEEEVKIKPSIIEIMEPSLRTCVMVSQFRSGMWRRNGYSLINQINFYHSPPLRKEMFGRDILAIQESAAMCDPNEFMIHLVNKFHLFKWFNSETTREPLVGRKAFSFQNDEEVIAHTMSLGEEFLQLILTVVGERYFVGIGKIGEEDVLKHEIIQLLCICPSTRSELTHKLSVFNDNELDCIKSIANLKRSTESTTGKYELKDEFYDRFNPFFYHYIRRDQSNALDAQLKRKRNLGQTLICCPPPRPVELTQQYSNLRQILKCDILLTLIQKILSRAVGAPDSSLECSTKAPIRFTASDLQLDQCLHLIGLGLHEQERDPLEFNYLLAANGKSIFSSLKSVYEEAKRSRDLITWLMKKTDEIILRLKGAKYEGVLDAPSVACLEQVNEIIGSILTIPDNSKQEGRKRNSEMAAQRRERIMAMMKSNQEKFLSNPSTKQLVADTEKAQTKPIASQAHTSGSNPPKTRRPASGLLGPRIKIKSGKSETRESVTSSVDQTDDTKDGISIDNDSEDNQMDYESATMDEEEEDLNSEPVEPTHMCILCRDEQKVAFNQPTMVLLAFIQRSSVLSKSRETRRIPYYSLTPTNQLKYLNAMHSNTRTTPDAYSFTSDNSWSYDANFMPSDLYFGPHISTCGHVMHYECWKGFYIAIHKRETSRPNRTARPVSFDLLKQEILCPLCECISNATIPLIPNYTSFTSRQSNSNGTSKQSVFGSSDEIIEASAENLSSCLRALRSAVDGYKLIRHIKEAKGIAYDDKCMRLLQPNNINDALENLDESDALGLRDFINTIRWNKITSNVCNTTLLNCITSLADRIHGVGLDFDRNIGDVNHARKFMMLSWSISYTIQSSERMARFKGSPLFEELQSSTGLCLSSLLRFACGSTMVLQQDIIQNYLVEKLRYLLINDEHSKSSPCCLDIDAFELFISIYIVLHKLYTHFEGSPNRPKQSNKSSQDNQLSVDPDLETGGYGWTTQAYDHEYFRNLLHISLILNMLQVMISMQNEYTEFEETVSRSSGNSILTSSKTSTLGSQSNSTDCEVLAAFYKDLIITSGHPNDKIPKVDELFLTRIRGRLLPFLRSCAIFFYNLSQIQPPQVLRTKSAFFEGKNFIKPPMVRSDQFSIMGANLVDNQVDAVNVEFDAICRYLDLPNKFSILLKSQEARQLAHVWLRHPRVLILINSGINESRQQQKQAESVNDTKTSSDYSTSKLKKRETSSSVSPSTLNLSKSELVPVKFISQPHTVNRLIDLPHDYSLLVDRVSDFSCPSIKNEDSRTPTMCLVCGLMLCSQNYCCQRDLNDLASNYQEVLQRNQTSSSRSFSLSDRGSPAISLPERPSPIFAFGGPGTPQEVSAIDYPTFAEALANLTNPNAIPQQLVGSCTYHAYECSGGVGVFLRIRNCQILLLSGRTKGCYMPAPYIDDHGEFDFGMIRGNPMYLDHRHYEKFQQMWLTHAIPRQISRALEYSTYASSINWHLH